MRQAQLGWNSQNRKIEECQKELRVVVSAAFSLNCIDDDLAIGSIIWTKKVGVIRNQKHPCIY